jgi:NAD(P)-dependent dehydrogenase (short-subunit alcohol dehydrogenase family)
MRIALVTGGNRGIGRAVVEELTAMGMTVLAGCRDAREPDAVRLDVTDEQSVKQAATVVAQRFGRLDVLVNNAGIAGGRDAQAPGGVDLDTVRKVFDTNLFGVIAVTEAMLPLLRASTAGRVVNVTSGLGSMARMSDPEDYFTGLPAVVAYAPSKSALNSVTVQYAKALRDNRILVNAADPGRCATDFTKDFPGVTRTAADGAKIIVRLATLPDGGPTGGYFNEGGRVPW